MWRIIALSGLPLLFLISLSFYQVLVAQSIVQFRGQVQAQGTKQPVSDVMVQLIETNQWSISDEAGHFQFQRLQPGAYTLVFRRVGWVTLQQNFTLTQANATEVVFVLQESSLALQEVTVTARETKLQSSSLIEQQAIRHVQPISLADVLQLVPGQLAVNPDLSNPQQILLRQAPIGAAGNRANALGTAVLLDGIPQSNNANLQLDNTILNSAPGSLPPFSSTANRGLDLRQIPADQIISVEVIRGVPSARYGDLTAGAVLVNTRAGVFTPTLTTRINPNLIQAGAGVGFKTSTYSTLSIDADIVSSQDDPRDFNNAFSRLNTQLTWSHNWQQNSPLRSTFRLGLYQGLDQSRQDPDAQNPLRSRQSNDRGIRFSMHHQYQPGWQWLNSLNLDAGLTYARQEGYFQDLIVRDIFPVSNALRDTTMAVGFGQSEYLNQTTVDGRPLNLYGRLELNTRWTTGILIHQLTAGAEARLDANNGFGRQFDPRTPPRQNYSVGDRPRSFRDIPTMYQLAPYLENKTQWTFLGRDWILQAGLRYDYLWLDDAAQEARQVLSPRLNMGMELLPGQWLRAGYGHTAKMPTLSVLYPNPTFYDLVNFNYYALDPAERLAVVTTRKITPDTRQITPYIARKWEIGADLFNSRLHITYFEERTTGAYQTIRSLQRFEVARLAAVEFPPGMPPILAEEPVETVLFWAAYDTPQNTLSLFSRGIEFSFDQPIRRWGTTINLNGAWIRSSTQQDAPFLDANRAIFASQTQSLIPIYPAGEGQETQRFNTSLRIIQHIPSLKFIVSALVQTVWVEANRLRDFSPYPEALLNLEGGLEQLSMDERRLAAFQNLRRGLNPVQLEWQKRPPLWLFNLRLTKELSEGLGFSFYVNNVWASRPLFVSNLSNAPQVRNQPNLFFGAEIFIKI